MIRTHRQIKVLKWFQLQQTIPGKQTKRSLIAEIPQSKYFYHILTAYFIWFQNNTVSSHNSQKEWETNCKVYYRDVDTNKNN